MSILMTRMSSLSSIEVAVFGGVPHGGAVEGAVEQLILGAHTSAHRTQARLRHRHMFDLCSDEPAPFACRHGFVLSASEPLCH
jgi:hypothetical protein